MHSGRSGIRFPLSAFRFALVAEVAGAVYASGRGLAAFAISSLKLLAFAPVSMSHAWQDCIGQVVVLDLVSPFVCVGLLVEVDRDCLLLEDADLHDLRDTATTREAYVLEVRRHGALPNRRRIWVTIREVVSLSRLEDVVD